MKNRLQVIKKRIVKTIFYVLLFVFALAATITGLLQLSSVQTWIVQEVANNLSERINYPISISSVDIDWFDTVILEDVSISDKKRDSFIGAEKIAVKVDLETLLNPHLITIEHIDVYNPIVSLDWDIESNKLNINTFIKSLRESLKKKKSKKPKFIPFQILSAEIHNGYFTYSDYRKSRINAKMFDHNYFSVDSIYAHLDDFYLHRDTIEMNIHHLHGREENIDFDVKDVNTFFRYTKASLEFEHVQAKIEDSYISNTVIFRYAKPTSINYFLDSVTVTLNLDSTVIQTKDLAHFAPPVRQFHDQWTFYGDYQGKVGNFRSNNSRIYFGRKSYLKGEISFQGLPNIKETFMGIILKNSRIASSDLASYLPNKSYLREARKFGTIAFDADFAGFPLDFTAHGDFRTKLGDFYSDLRFEILKDQAMSKYEGHLKTEEFNIGRLIDDKRVGTVAINGSVKGQGFSIKKAKVDINATLQHIEINKYKFKNITTDAHFEHEKFNGLLDIKDTNLVFNAEGNLDLTTTPSIIDIKSELKKAQLREINLTKDSIYLSSSLDLNLKGLDIDNITGDASLKDTYIYHDGIELDLDDFNFESSLDSNNRDFHIASSLVNFDATGEFKFREVFKGLKGMIYEYGLLFRNDSTITSNYYKTKSQDSTDYHIDFKAQLHDINPLLSIFYPNVKISPKTEIDGRVSQNNSSVVDLSSKFDYFQFDDFTFLNNTLEISAAKRTDSTEALAMCYLTSKQQNIKGIPRTKELLFDGVWHRDTINFISKINQYKRTNFAHLKGNILFKNNTIETTLKDSKVKLINKIWAIDENNQITVSKDLVHFKDLSLQNINQRITINGKVGKQEKASLLIEKFNLLNLEPLIGIKLQGIFNGIADVSGIAEQNLFINSHMEINDFKIKEEAVGDFSGSWQWKDSKKQLEVDAVAYRDGAQIAQLTGEYNANNEKSPLNMNAHFKKTNIKFLEPLLYGHVTDLVGFADGDIKIKGPLSHPKFYGHPTVKDGALTIDYFKTRYSFDETIYFIGDSIYLKNAVLTDTLWKTKGTIHGGITHHFFKDFKANIDIDLDNTFVLNTEPKDNTLYYGQAFGTGKIHASGPFSDLFVISDEIKSEKGTKIYVPLDGTESISTKEYIEFVSPTTLKIENEEEKKRKINTAGITAELNFDVTEDAHFEVIFDKKAGDIIKGTGTGTVLMKMDTRGDFEVYGTYEITQGTYNFTLVNLINKAFVVEPKSRVTWNGDPYEGQLDIRAAHTQNASILPLLKGLVDSTFIQDNPDVRRRIPVTVFLTLDGRLLNPQIGFDIDIQEYPNYLEVEQAINDLKSRIKFNEQLLNNQVFSLMVLKQLSPLEQLQVDIGSSSANSVSELLSNQFSNWISQFDDNLEVDIDLSGFDEADNNTFRLRMSYSILDGKIRVTRDGNITNLQNESQLANVFGEWTIEYLLTDDGKLKMKAYNKTNQNTYSTSLSNATSTIYGLSMTYTKSFDSLIGLFRRNPNKSEGIKEDEVLAPESPQEKKQEDTPPNTESEEKNSLPNE